MKLGSGAFEGAFTFASRVEEGPGTNPEELVGAAQAGCFSMFLAAVLTGAGFPPKQIRTSAKVHLGEGPRIDLHGAAPAQHAVPAGGSVDNFLYLLLQYRPTNGIEKYSYAWRTRLGQAVRGVVDEKHLLNPFKVESNLKYSHRSCMLQVPGRKNFFFVLSSSIPCPGLH